jgi:hypothetical protein
MNTALMFSSGKCEWETPQAVFDALHKAQQFRRVR